jgi:hypothetical protein
MRVAIFAEVDTNFAEGPAIWLVAVARMLAARSGWAVTILLRTRRIRSEVLEPLSGLDNVTLVDPFSLGWTEEAVRPQLSVERAVDFLERLDKERRFDAFILRGAPVSCVAAGRASLHGRLACYLTDFPQPPARFGFLTLRKLRRAVGRMSLLLCQTPELRDYLKGQLGLSHRPPTALLPPVVGDATFGSGPPPPMPDAALRLAYIGKFAPAWRSLEMCALPQVLAEHGIDCRLEIAGDRFLAQPDGTFPDRMRQVLANSRGVVWHGGLSQAEAQRLASTCHMGLSWRGPELDDSLELSTKLLEYGALGLPVLCNPTKMHRRLLGDNYPFFVTEAVDFVSAARKALQPESWRAGARATRLLAEDHRESKIGMNLTGALSEAFA